MVTERKHGLRLVNATRPPGGGADAVRLVMRTRHHEARKPLVERYPN